MSILGADRQVKAAIQEGTAPFLGLLGEKLSEEAKFAIDVATIAQPSVEAYIKYLKQYPALFAVNLTKCLMEGMGQTGGFEIYTHVERAIGTQSSLSATEKEKLWRAFRDAILALGFIASPRISGPHYMADEYLRQVGVPLAFADDLASRMLNFAKRVGLPDEDDPEAIASWQTALQSRLGPPFSVTASKAVALDAQGYYTRVFLGVNATGGIVSGTANALEQAMARAFSAQGGLSSFKRAVLPYPMLHDGTLGIFIPAGDGREFEVQVGSSSQTLRAGAEDKFLAINDSLPKAVSIREVRSSQASSYDLWQDGRSNRILFFSDTGRFKSAEQIANPARHLILPPGQYTCISRFAPAEMDSEEFWDEPQQFLFSLMVLPGSATSISNGPASLVIEGESQPLAIWIGVNKTTKEGVEFYFGSLTLTVQLPPDWLAFSGKNYALNVSASGINEHFELPLILRDDGSVTVSLSNEFSARGWKAGFGRVLIELHRIGEERSLLRSAIYYWHGLARVSRELSFDCDAMPCNLEATLCENITAKGRSLAPDGVLSRTLRLVFRLDERRTQSLTWNVPGIYIEVETPTDKGSIQRHSVAAGKVEVVSYISPKQILISANDPGELRLGDWVQYVDFSRTPTKRLAAAFLVSHISPQSNRLIYRNLATGIDFELLNLVQPHSVESVTPRLTDGLLKIVFVLPRGLEALTIRAQDMVSGKNFESVVEANEGRWSSHSFGRAQLMCITRQGGGESAELLLDLEVWPAGAWLLRFDGRVDGILGHLENERQDQFAVGFLCSEQGNPISERKFLSRISELSDNEALEMLARVSDALRYCYAEQVWPSIKWLGEAWRTLVAHISGLNQSTLHQLVALAAIKSPEDASPSWMLQQTIGSSMPRIFCWPANAYRTVEESLHPLPRALTALAWLDADYPHVFPSLLHFSIAAGYTNFRAVAQGANPNGFQMRQYIEALRQMGAGENYYRLEDDNFLPKAGDLLGPLHYRYAMRQFEDAYDRTSAGNDIRRGQAMGLCSYVRRVMPSLTRDDAPRLDGVAPSIDPWPDDDVALDAQEAQRKDNLANVAHTLSWLAYHCRLETKVKGSLKTFLTKLQESNSPVETSLAYLLQVGGEVFGFYLVLWEAVIRAECIGG